MTLLDFWPTAENLHDCFVALQSGDPTMVMAVHQPMQIRRNDTRDAISKPTTERELLETILGDQQSKVITFSGQKGVGKSHLQSWLVAELNRHPDGQRRIVLPFQASDTRATVLLKLAEALPNSSALHAARMTSKTLTLPSQDLPSALRDRFVKALEKIEAEAKQRLGEAKQQGIPPSAYDRDVGTWLAKGLRDYLSDPITGKPFLAPRTGVFSALAEDIVSRRDNLPSTSIFREEHFARQEGVDILRASNPAQLFYKKLNLTSDQFRTLSAKLMNQLTAEVMIEFAPTSELLLLTIVEQVQQELHATRRELIILIEESDAPGDLTPMAANGQKWTIEPRNFANRSELSDAIIDFVATYLHAAGVMEEELDTEDRVRVEAFGRPKPGQSLFPLNRAAIRQIADLANFSELHPAHIIERFFEGIILPYRQAFLEGRFPPANFLDFDFTRIGEDVRRTIEQHYPDKVGQYLSLLAFWGGCPSSLNDIQLSELIYQAFGLEPLQLTTSEGVAPTPAATHPEVRAFYEAVRAGGAGLDLLTPTVLRWLTESRQFHDFFIVEKRREDEISCGLA